MNGENSVLLPPGGKTITDVHATPRDFYAKLDAEFGFNLDPCSDGTNAVTERFFTPADDGLSRDWGGAWLGGLYEPAIQRLRGLDAQGAPIG